MHFHLLHLAEALFLQQLKEVLCTLYQKTYPLAHSLGQELRVPLAVKIPLEEFRSTKKKKQVI